MPKNDLMTGASAAAYGTKLSRPKVVAAYPITPSTPIVERIASFIMHGELDAQYIPVESEHSAMGACVGASLCGVRAFTSTASQGLAYMHEFVHLAHGYHLPIVMGVANRSLASPWATTCDYSDTMAENTSGWLQLYVENGQEALDTIIQAYRVAEDKRVLLPAMVCMDGFLISHTTEPVEIPDQSTVDSFLPAYAPEHMILDPDVGISAVLPPRPWVMRYEHMTDDCMNTAKQVVEEVGEEYGKTFGRSYGLVDPYKTKGADVLLITMGSMSGTAKVAVDELRKEGIDAGVVRIRSFRPFPSEALKRAVEEAKVLAVVDRDIVHGVGGRGGAVFAELKSSLYDLDNRPRMFNFIAGLAGRDITVEHLKSIAKKSLAKPDAASSVEWLDEIPALAYKTASLERYKERIVCPGIRTCAGCGALIAIRHMMQVLGTNTVFTMVPGCAAVTMQSIVPLKSLIRLPYAEVCFAGTASVATGMKAAFKARGKPSVNVLGLAGDGATVDIGFQALSAAAERGESIIYVCYDNEAYMNTGVQKSGSTPFGALTTTTPEGARRTKRTIPKDMPTIMALHGIPYVATASVAYVPDLLKKIEKAAKVTQADRGLAYIHVHCPCPPGWGYSQEKTVEVARLAVQTGMWTLYEIEDGRTTMNVKLTKRKPVAEYLKVQDRFANLSHEDLRSIQEQLDQRWESHKEKGFLTSTGS